LGDVEKINLNSRITAKDDISINNIEQ
jgi:hypothetical protein